MNAMEERVSPEMNEELQKDFKAKEVWTALKQMHPTKALSLDGMSPIFYQTYWDIVGPSVTNCVLLAFNLGVMSKELKNTYLPNSQDKKPQTITEYRPISLCNMIYKIMSKVLANRLKKVLHGVINEAQSAFVLGRLIMDNVIVAFEIMHSIDKKRKGLMAVKLDMSKAYNRVEWTYLESMMKKMGFGERWIFLIMMCVTSVTYSILINGEPKGAITSSRGPNLPILVLVVWGRLVGNDKKERKGGAG